MEQSKPKFKVGDTVEIVGYGSLCWVPKSEAALFNKLKVIQETETFLIVDHSPDEVGKIGIVRNVTITQGKIEYALYKTGKQSWFNEEQLKKITNHEET